MSYLDAIDIYEFCSDAIDEKKVDQFIDAHDKAVKTQGISKELAVKVLRSTIDANRSGSIVNFRCYNGYRMQQGNDSWTSPYPKPVLPHHRDADGGGGMFSSARTAEDALGRVYSAKFNPFSGSDLRNDYATARLNGRGSGQTILQVDIVGKDNQQKVIDKRYLTVSTSQRTTDARCSICGGSAKEGCDHRPGRMYAIDKKSPLFSTLSRDAESEKKIHALCFLIWDSAIENREVSFVNVPAQQYAGVLSTQWVEAKDSAGVDTEIFDVDVYNGANDNLGVTSLRYLDGINTIELMADDWFQIPSGLYVSAPLIAQDNDKSMNMDSESSLATEDTKNEDVNKPSQTEKNEGTTVSKELEAQLAEANKIAADAKAEVVTLTSDRDGLKAQVEDLTKANDAANESIVKSLADTLFNMRQTCGSIPTDVSEEDTKTAMDDLISREANSLSDAIKDLRPRFQEALEALREPKAGDTVDDGDEDAKDKADEDGKTVGDDTKDAAGTVDDPTAGSGQRDAVPTKASLAAVLGFSNRKK